MFHSGPLSQISDGQMGFLAAAELGVDVATVGNHDLDYGLEAFQAGCKNVPYPIVCANQSSLGLPPGCLIETPVGPIGFIGVTHPESHLLWQYSAKPLRVLPAPDVTVTDAVVSTSKELRRTGALAVVVLLHDGLGLPVKGIKAVSEVEELLTRLAPWAENVDAILAGHTLLQFVGSVGSTPIIQPYGLGCSIGVLDLNIGSYEVRAHSHTFAVKGGDRWSGPGADLLDEAEADTLGYLDVDLYNSPSGTSTLADFAAESIRSLLAADLALVFSICGQAPLDGKTGWWGSGRVSYLQLLQAFPWVDRAVVTAEIAADEAEKLLRDIERDRHGAVYSWGIAVKVPRERSSLRIVVTGGSLAAQLPILLGRHIDWTIGEVSFRECISAALSKGC
jgi:hypothetical protein